MSENRIQIVITANSSGAVSGIRQVRSEVQNLSGSASSNNSSVVSSFDSISSAMQRVRSLAPQVFLGLGIYESIRMFADFTQQLVETHMRFEQMQKGMEAISGSKALAAGEFEFVTEESNRLGLELMSTAEAYKQMSAAAMGTTLQGEQTRQVFSAVADASRVLGLSNEQVQGIFLALGQMISKGTVQAEELRGQLGERLPGAFQIAAKAMGVTTAELDKMLQEGKVMTEDFLPKFAQALENRFAKDVPASADQTAAAVNRMKNAWKELAENIWTGSGMDKAYRSLIDGTTRVLHSINEAIPRLKLFWGSLKQSAENNDWIWDAAIKAREAQTVKTLRPVVAESYAGIGGGVDGPARRAPTPEAPDIEALRALEASQNDLQRADLRIKFVKDLAQAMEQARSPLEVYTDLIKKYDLWLSAAKSDSERSDIAFLKRKATEDYEQSIAEDPVVPLGMDDLSHKLSQFDQKRREILQSLASADNEYYANLAERSGDFYKAEEIRMHERISKRRDSYDKDVAQWEEMLKEMERDVGKYQAVSPAVSRRLKDLRQMLAELRANDPARKAQIENQERDQTGYLTGQKAVENREQLAQLDLDYVKLTGSMRDQLDVQIRLIDATAARNMADKPDEIAGAYARLAQEQKRVLEIEYGGSFLNGFFLAAEKYRHELPTIAQQGERVFDAFVNSINNAADALTEFTMTGKMDFADFSESIIRDILRMEYQALLTRAIMGNGSGEGLLGWLTGLFGGGGGGENLAPSWNPSFNVGDLWSYGIPGFAGGTVVNQPTLAWVGEGGDSEAVVPLPDGRSIPVDVRGGSTRVYGDGGRIPMVTVNVDNRTGVPVSKDQVSVRQDLEGTVVGIVLRNYSRGGDVWKMIRGASKNG